MFIEKVLDTHHILNEKSSHGTRSNWNSNEPSENKGTIATWTTQAILNYKY